MNRHTPQRTYFVGNTFLGTNRALFGSPLLNEFGGFWFWRNDEHPPRIIETQ
jgi:hypothetical protein